MSFPTAARRRLLLVPAAIGLLATLGACERQPLEPLATTTSGDSVRPAPLLAVISCTASRASTTVRCAAPAARSRGASGDIIVGGQNQYVTLTSSSVAYNSGTGQFTFNTTLTNLIPQPMGTTDGTTLDPNGVRIFFATGPATTSGTGSVSVVPDGFGTFTATGQPYYQYNEIVAPNATSSAKTWTLIMPPTVNTFSFTLFVSAPVQFPHGFIGLTFNGNSLRPAVQQTLVATPQTAVGRPVDEAAPLQWSSSDPTIATVDGSGNVVGVKAGTVSIIVSDGTRIGQSTVYITAVTRSWNGSVSTDFNDPANWDALGPLAPAVVPVASDSIIVPAAAANQPLLTSTVTLAGVRVNSGATLTLDHWNLFVTGPVAALGTGGGSPGSITSTTGIVYLDGGALLEGILPNVMVDGDYTLSNDLSVSTLQVVAGTLTNAGFLVQQQ